MAELRMYQPKKWGDAITCVNLARGYADDCCKRIALAIQHPEFAQDHLRIARTLLDEADRILRHGTEHHLSTVLVVGNVANSTKEAANG